MTVLNVNGSGIFENICNKLFYGGGGEINSTSGEMTLVSIFEEVVEVRFRRNLICEQMLLISLFTRELVKPNRCAANTATHRNGQAVKLSLRNLLYFKTCNVQIDKFIFETFCILTFKATLLCILEHE